MTAPATETVILEVAGFDLLIQGTVRKWPDGKIVVSGHCPDLGRFASHWAEHLAARTPGIHSPVLLRNQERQQCYRFEWSSLPHPATIQATVWKTEKKRRLKRAFRMRGL